MKCTDAQINGMDLYHTTNYLEDYPKDFIETAAKYMCDMLGVPLKTNKYDLVEVIVKGINNESPTDQLAAHETIERQDDKSPNDTQTQTIVYQKDNKASHKGSKR